jgi:riboflavin synthase
MFTGIVELMGRVTAWTPSPTGGGRLLVDGAGGPGWQLEVGESVAVNGVCLTVVARQADCLAFDLAEETRRVTTLGELSPEDRVNLERPLRLDGRLGGHLVLGHVDAVGRVSAMVPEGAGRRLTVEVPAGLRPLLVPKGSVTVDGVSLTVAELSPASFVVALVPHTLAVTTLGVRGPGSRVNLEMDVIGKYVRELMGQAGCGGAR